MRSMLASQQPRNQVQHIVVTSAHEGQRVDNFLFTFLRGVPKSHVYRIIRQGQVRVNKKRINVHYRLAIGDDIRIPPIRVAEKKEDILKQPSGKLIKILTAAICYEDDQLLIINKPSGLASHGGSGISLGLIEALRLMRPKAPFLELVHRLDRETSGCIMIAKKRSMLKYLHECLKEGTIEKNYLALVQGRWQGKDRLVDAPLLKYVLRSGERMVKVDPAGKFAQTAVEILELYPQATLVKATPLTGRTHQIRVHCALKGHPIIGDEKYGDAEYNRQVKLQGADRLFLHAQKLVINLPYLSSPLTVTCPLPASYHQFCESLRKTL